MRYTEYHAGVPVIKNKSLLPEAIKKLAMLEDEEDKECDKCLCPNCKADCPNAGFEAKACVYCEGEAIYECCNYEN